MRQKSRKNRIIKGIPGIVQWTAKAPDTASRKHALLGQSPKYALHRALYHRHQRAPGQLDDTHVDITILNSRGAPLAQATVTRQAWDQRPTASEAEVAWALKEAGIPG